MSLKHCRYRAINDAGSLEIIISDWDFFVKSLPPMKNRINFASFPLFFLDKTGSWSIIMYTTKREAKPMLCDQECTMILSLCNCIGSGITRVGKSRVVDEDYSAFLANSNQSCLSG
jgi:hypothetical protein